MQKNVSKMPRMENINPIGNLISMPIIKVFEGLIDYQNNIVKIVTSARTTIASVDDL